MCGSSQSAELQRRRRLVRGRLSEASLDSPRAQQPFPGPRGATYCLVPARAPRPPAPPPAPLHLGLGRSWTMSAPPQEPPATAQNSRPCLPQKKLIGGLSLGRLPSFTGSCRGFFLWRFGARSVQGAACLSRARTSPAPPPLVACSRGSRSYCYCYHRLWLLRLLPGTLRRIPTPDFRISPGGGRHRRTRENEYELWAEPGRSRRTS